MRPRFESLAPLPVDEATRRLRAALERPDAWPRGSVFRGHAVLYVPDAEQRIWSPFLSVDLDGLGEQTRVRGRYGPKPSTWSLFIAAYAICGCFIVFGTAFGWSQASIGQTPWAYSVVLAAAVGALVVYGLARWGQHLGRGQMEQLREFLDEAVATEEAGTSARTRA